MSEKVCAIVVTYNRKDLLMDCINSILSQTRQVEGICIVDNNSTDGTPKALYEKGLISSLPPEVLFQPWMIETVIQNPLGQELAIHYIRNNVNTGGAGGFNLGIKKAFKQGYDWFWLMDDDVYADKEALKNLLGGYSKIKKVEAKIGFLCSHVTWVDGTPHVMNLPNPTLPWGLGRDKTPYNIYIKDGILRITSCSFVSCLIHKDAISKVGLPIKEMFIYADDVEFTERIIAKGYSGFYVVNSIVIHKTKNNEPVSFSSIQYKDLIRIFHEVKNNIYLNKKKGIIFLLRYILIDFYNHLRNSLSKGNLKGFYYIVKGLIHGLVFNPKIEKIEN